MINPIFLFLYLILYFILVFFLRSYLLWKKTDGRLVIMDWYIPKPSLRGVFLKWIGKGEVNCLIYQYLKTKVANFSIDTSFKRGGVFIATGIK